MNPEKIFGPTVRQRRKAHQLTLRGMAKTISVSAAYLSKIERDDYPPPAEDKVRAIAELLDFDLDELLGLAGKVSTDLTEIIKKRPREMASLLRSASKMTAEEIDQTVQTVQRFLAEIAEEE